MTAKERDRLKVLQEMKKRHITQKQAAAELGLSARGMPTVRWARNSNAVLCPSRTPIPGVQPEVSTVHKSGSFYFASTATEQCGQVLERGS